MAIRVVRYDMDPLKSGLTRDNWDKNLRRASATFVLSGSVAGMVLTLQSPTPGAAPIVITEGVDWTETADVFESMHALLAAITSLGGGLLTPKGPVSDASGSAMVVLQAPSAGSWGEGITVDVDAAGANLEVNGNAGPTTENLTDGAGPDAVQAFQDFLNNLAGSPTIDELIIVPLTLESTSFLVIWDDTP